MKASMSQLNKTETFYASEVGPTVRLFREIEVLNRAYRERGSDPWPAIIQLANDARRPNAAVPSLPTWKTFVWPADGRAC